MIGAASLALQRLRIMAMAVTMGAGFGPTCRYHSQWPATDGHDLHRGI